MSFDFILPACNAETLLIKTIGFDTKNHQTGDGQVINLMDKKKFQDKLLIGIMDKPIGNNPSHVRTEFKDIDNNRFGIILKKKNHLRHYIVYINEVMEDWIVNVGNLLKIERPFKNNDARFQAEMKRANHPNIIAYFSQIKQRNPQAFKLINRHVNDIIKNKI
jgi:hypothetical protein